MVPALEALLAAALERDRLQAEVVETRALRRSDELKTALLRSVSHDLRTPLTAILTAGSALAEGEISRADRQELGRAIIEEAERLTALVEKLLDLSRLQAGSAEPRRQWCSVDELLREAATQLDPDGTRFAFTIDAELPLVRADPIQLERAFANLLENALRYSAPSAGLGARAGRRRAAADPHRRPRARASRTRISRGSSRPSTAAPRSRRAAPAPGSAWRSSRASSRPTAAACGRSRCPARARASWSRCRSSRRPRTASPAGEAQLP